MPQSKYSLLDIIKHKGHFYVERWGERDAKFRRKCRRLLREGKIRLVFQHSHGFYYEPIKEKDTNKCL